MTYQQNPQGVTFGRAVRTHPHNMNIFALWGLYSDGVTWIFGKEDRRGWRAGWNALAVIALVVAAITVSVFTATANPALGYIPDPAIGIVVAAIAGLVLLVRRRLPLTVLFVTAAAFAADTVVIPLAIAVYTVAAANAATESNWPCSPGQPSTKSRTGNDQAQN